MDYQERFLPCLGLEIWTQLILDLAEGSRAKYPGGSNRFGSQFRHASTASRVLEQTKCAGAERDFRDRAECYVCIVHVHMQKVQDYEIPQEGGGM